jgi:hypothetical protein
LQRCHAVIRAAAFLFILLRETYYANRSNKLDVKLNLMSFHVWIFLTIFLAIGSPLKAQDASSLRQRHADLKDRLASNQFQRPLVLESHKSTDNLSGSIYSETNYSFTKVRQALYSVDNWCDILILHLNIKHCKVTRSDGASGLSLAVGKRYNQPLNEAYPLNFSYQLAANSSDYLQILLNAGDGPFGTKNYRIQLQATSLDKERSIIQMSYAFSYGLAARVAMNAYLATVGRSKVGFTIVNRTSDGRPIYIRSMLGMVERNTMRYYLAIDSYLNAYSLPASKQMERRLNEWYESTERYATQLHEISRPEYVNMKHNEIRRQRAK